MKPTRMRFTLGGMQLQRPKRESDKRNWRVKSTMCCECIGMNHESVVFCSPQTIERGFPFQLFSSHMTVRVSVAPKTMSLSLVRALLQPIAQNSNAMPHGAIMILLNSGSLSCTLLCDFLTNVQCPSAGEQFCAGFSARNTGV